MVYMPLYATVSDNQGGYGHTLSRRGITDEVSARINTKHGEAIHVSAMYIDGRREVVKPDLRSIPKGEKRDAALKAYDEAVEKADKVIIDITPNFDEHFEVRMAGITFTGADLKLLQNFSQEQFLGRLSVAAAFGMIPDIKRMTDAPTDANVSAFIEKMEKIKAFIEGEEKRIWNEKEGKATA